MQWLVQSLHHGGARLLEQVYLAAHQVLLFHADFNRSHNWVPDSRRVPQNEAFTKISYRRREIEAKFNCISQG